MRNQLAQELTAAWSRQTTCRNVTRKYEKHLTTLVAAVKGHHYYTDWRLRKWGVPETIIKNTVANKTQERIALKDLKPVKQSIIWSARKYAIGVIETNKAIDEVRVIFEKYKTLGSTTHDIITSLDNLHTTDKRVVTHLQKHAIFKPMLAFSIYLLHTKHHWTVKKLSEYLETTEISVRRTINTGCDYANRTLRLDENALNLTEHECLTLIDNVHEHEAKNEVLS